jgi:Flp pilus assembly protein TadG
MRDLVTRLGRPVLRLMGRDERGVSAVLITVLIGGGVLIGMGALVIDVGQIYQNRAELQNGADAGALAVAKSCVLNACQPAVATAEAVNNSSALTNHQAGVLLVCGSGTLGLCPANTGTTGDITNCPVNPPAGTNYVDVRTQTKASGGSLLPPVFARTLLGNQNYNGTSVFACAQVEWGPSLQSNSLALTLSYCAWSSITGGNKFNTLIPVYLKNDNNPTAKPCSGPAGSNVPGGFDWLQTTSNTVCTAIIDLTTNTTYSNTGVSISAACKQTLVGYVDAYNAGTPITLFVPVFDASSGTGNNATYTIMGLAGFVITGFAHLPGGGNPTSDGPTNALCTGSAPCLEGYFLPGIDPVSDGIGPGNNFGAITIKLTG